MSNQCGKGWNERCASAKSRKCRCSCGGENHGTKQKRDSDVSQLTGDDLHYAWDEKRVHDFLPSSAGIREVRFTRLAGEPSFMPGISQRGKVVIELVYPDHIETLQHRYVRHSPDGFEFGYGGSGPAEAALNILAVFVGIKNATELYYQDFKFKFVATISQEDGGSIGAQAIRDWIYDAWSALTVKENIAQAVVA